MAKKKTKTMHKMPGGMLMKDADMPGIAGAKPKFGTPEFFAGLKKGGGKAKKTRKKRTRGGKK